MNQRNKSEKGQALVLIVFAIIGTLSLVGLAIDGGQTFSDRRKVQNAADAAALVEALTYRENVDKGREPYLDVETNALNAAATNGYTNGVNSTVTIDPPVVSPAGSCPSGTDGQDFKVTITSTVKTSFAPVVGVNELQNTVTATARSCEFHYQPFLLGNAIVGTNPGPEDCAFDSDTGNAAWKVHGGGVFSNGCAKAKGNVTFDPGYCASAPDKSKVTGFSCTAYGPTYKFPNDFEAMMPPNPCDKTALPGETRYFPAEPPKNGSVTYENGIYCISDFDAYDKVTVTLHNATLYVTDPVFDLKFAGSGGFDGYASRAGKFAGMYLVVAMTPKNVCDKFNTKTAQTFEFRGNGQADLEGSIWAPTACVDFRGNSNSKSMNSQLIGYNVTANGTADVEITYNQKSTMQQVVPPTVELVK